MGYLQKGYDIDLETLKDKPSEWWEQRVIEGKIDGGRALFRKGVITSYGGNRFHNIKPLLDELKDLCQNYVLDGELYQNSWEETMSVIKSSKTYKVMNGMKFYVFDALTVKEYNDRICYMPYRDRLHRLKKIFNAAACHPKIYISSIPLFNVSSYSEFTVAKNILIKHHEGVMIKELMAPYEFCRSKSWLKWKPRHTTEVTIIGFNEGKGKYVGMLGSFVCRDTNNLPKTVNISGMSDNIRVLAWRYPKLYIGQIIEIEYVKRTKNGTLYGAQFKRMRGAL